jgi:hypothetical protein
LDVATLSAARTRSKHIAIDLFNPWDSTNKVEGDGHIMTVRSHAEEEAEER